MSGQDPSPLPALLAPEGHEELAVFRESFLVFLSPRQAAGMRGFARTLCELAFGAGAGLGGASHSPPAHLAALAAELRLVAVSLHSFAAIFAQPDGGGERLGRTRRVADQVHLLALRLDEEEESWKKKLSQGEEIPRRER